MQTVEIKKRKLDPDGFIGRYADDSDCKTRIDFDAKVYLDGELSMVHLHDIGIDLEPFYKELSSFKKWTSSTRTTKRSSLKSTSKTFGYLPRNPLRGQPCNPSVLCKQSPELWSKLMSISELVSDIYKKENDKLWSKHNSLANEKLKTNYRISKTPFTTGIINKSSRLQYHFDAGNFADVWSAMLCVSNGIHGGDLCLPELNTRVEISNGSLTFFNGQGLIHGVSKFKRTRENAERYTIVWYSLVRLWQCLAQKDEVNLMNERQVKLIKKKAGKHA
jgi:hypothetical protein